MAVAFAVLAAPLRGQQPDFDAWRASFSERLDQSVAELRVNAERERNAQLAATWGRSTETQSPPVFPLSLRDNEDQNRFPTLTSILREKGLPASLLGVAEVESGFNPRALSPQGARGLWQLMPETARRYGLVVERQIDERIDPVKSTFAAAEYMKDLYARFGDWPLALAAYNAGEDRVERALRRVGTRDFWTLRQQGVLPDETLRYVPAVLARLQAPLSSSAPASTSLTASTPTFLFAKDPAARGHIVYAGTAVPLAVPAGSERF